ncbi:tetranectin isoform X2 [Pantherophis guttatus]|uniref:Tetranectin isoform X2 n=1 Tax=Pantherophis guttatus TaxID=94885 RepID=A0ABM3YTT4_PANGU|nr:tetranectin-like isoform X2 [Pantherophis guttatus]XP_060541937.1 tetranectin isoform X2 [Pantherophis guttatus]
MPFRIICFLVCVLCVTQITAQQNTRPKKKPEPRKDAVSLRMIEDFKEQLENLSQEVALLKEKQALQTVCLKGTKINLKCVLAFSHAKTYHEANEDCISQGGTLSTPQTVTDIWTHPIRPITVMEDNESVVYISESHFTGSRSRHIDIRYQNIKHLVKKGFVKMQYVSTHDQIADMLNKPLPAAQHEYLCKKMCLI